MTPGIHFTRSSSICTALNVIPATLSCTMDE